MAGNELSVQPLAGEFRHHQHLFDIAAVESMTAIAERGGMETMRVHKIKKLAG